MIKILKRLYIQSLLRKRGLYGGLGSTPLRFFLKSNAHKDVIIITGQPWGGVMGGKHQKSAFILETIFSLPMLSYYKI